MFVDLPEDTLSKVRKEFLVHVPDPHRPAVRFVCSWATTEDEVEAALNAIAPD